MFWELSYPFGIRAGKAIKHFLEVIERTFPDKALQNKIRRDISVSEASIYGKPVFETDPESRAGEDYLAVTKEILQRLKYDKTCKAALHH